MGANQIIDRLPYLPILAHLARSCCNHLASLEIQPTNVGSGRLEAPADRRHRGWAEQHPVARMAYIPQNVARIYAPRDAQEIGVVAGLVDEAYRYASGVVPDV